MYLCCLRSSSRRLAGVRGDHPQLTQVPEGLVARPLPDVSSVQLAELLVFVWTEPEPPAMNLDGHEVPLHRAEDGALPVGQDCSLDVVVPQRVPVLQFTVDEAGLARLHKLQAMGHVIEELYYDQPPRP